MSRGGTRAKEPISAHRLLSKSGSSGRCPGRGSCIRSPRAKDNRQFRVSYARMQSEGSAKEALTWQRGTSDPKIMPWRSIRGPMVLQKRVRNA